MLSVLSCKVLMEEEWEDDVSHREAAHCVTYELEWKRTVLALTPRSDPHCHCHNNPHTSPTCICAMRWFIDAGCLRR
jgi:hypothetical protein